MENSNKSKICRNLPCFFHLLSRAEFCKFSVYLNLPHQPLKNSPKNLKTLVQKSIHFFKNGAKINAFAKKRKKAGRDSIKNLEDGRPMRRLWPSYSLWFGITMMGTKTCCNPSVKSCSTTFRVIHKLRFVYTGN